MKVEIKLYFGHTFNSHSIKTGLRSTILSYLFISSIKMGHHEKLIGWCLILLFFILCEAWFFRDAVHIPKRLSSFHSGANV